MRPINFNASNVLTTPRCKFEGDAASSAEEVKNLFIFENIPVIEDIKKVLARKVSSWPCLKVFSWSENPAFKGPANYSHL